MKLWKKIVAQILSVVVIMSAGVMNMKIQAEERYNIGLSASGNDVSVNFDNPGDGAKMRFWVSEGGMKFDNPTSGTVILDFTGGNEVVRGIPGGGAKDFGLRLMGPIEKNFSLNVELIDQDDKVISGVGTVSFSVPVVSTPAPSNNTNNESSNNNDNNNNAAVVDNTAAKTCVEMAAPDLFQIRTNVDKATLYWSAMNGVVSYKISYGQRPNEKAKTVTAPSPTATGNATYTLTGLEVDTTYYFTIVAVDECGKESKAAVVLAGKTYNRVATFYKYK